MSIMENEFRILLRESLSDKFNLDELNTLCFDLNIDYEDIPGNNKQAKVVELIKYCERTDQMDLLIAQIVKIRPNLKASLAEKYAQVSIESLDESAISPPVVARPVNLSFDSFTIGDWPSGWFNSKGFVPTVSTNYRAKVVARPDEGAGSCVVFWNFQAKENEFGSLMQRCPAHYLAGRVIRLTADIKTERVAQWAGMWLRADGDLIPDLVFDNMSNRPIKGTTLWKNYLFEVHLPKETAWLNYGIILVGEGMMWADNFELTVWTEPGRWKAV